MEIIYLVFLVFSRSNLEEAHIHAWHNYNQGPKHLLDRPCERAVQSKEFQKHLQAKLDPDREGRVFCRTASQMESFYDLVKSPGVEITANEHPGTDQSQKTVRIQGRLLHTPYDSSRRSVEAYMGQEFFLVQNDGTRVALYPTEEVSRETLLKKKDQTISVLGRFVDRTPDPDAGMPISYPMDPEGGPLKRTGYEVLKLLP